MKEIYCDRKGIWGKGYFVSTVGINEKIIKEYIKMQEKEDIEQVSLSFECTTPVKTWESILLKKFLENNFIFYFEDNYINKNINYYRSARKIPEVFL